MLNQSTTNPLGGGDAESVFPHAEATRLANTAHKVQVAAVLTPPMVFHGKLCIKVEGAARQHKEPARVRGPARIVNAAREKMKIIDIYFFYNFFLHWDKRAGGG